MVVVRLYFASGVGSRRSGCIAANYEKRFKFKCVSVLVHGFAMHVAIDSFLNSYFHYQILIVEECIQPIVTKIMQKRVDIVKPSVQVLL